MAGGQKCIGRNGRSDRLITPVATFIVLRGSDRVKLLVSVKKLQLMIPCIPIKS